MKKHKGTLGTVDDRLGDFGVLDEDDDDFSAADFFAAQETAASPVFGKDTTGNVF
ncbi:hypothetical protein [Syntrophomonas wolfei]|uniref:hypothetical protein n=1 Tax=Syntrophomonas wolfei TaxID=863 RepID=UPI0002ED2778|nr:hypothetical protein [Syntrophomonas wolfei]